MEDKEWFSAWFDSPYYHILYAKRDETEAARFISSLQEKLQLASGSRVLDAACGKGRHAITLQSLGFIVDAFDLSANNIEHAKEKKDQNIGFLKLISNYDIGIDYYEGDENFENWQKLELNSSSNDINKKPC